MFELFSSLLPKSCGLVWKGWSKGFPEALYLKTLCLVLFLLLLSFGLLGFFT